MDQLTTSILTNSVGFIMGALAGGFVVVGWIRRRYDLVPKERPMNPTPEARRARHRTYLGVALIVGSFVIIATGLQMWLYQQQQDDEEAAAKARAAADRARIQCIETWGKGLVEIVETRTGENEDPGTIDLEKAAEARDNALDDALLLIRADRDTPPPPREQVQAAARRYYAAVRELRRVRDDVAQTRTNNPYPSLDC